MPLEQKKAPSWTLDLGANGLADGSTAFCLWAPKAQHVALQLNDDSSSLIEMQPTPAGYFKVQAKAPAGTRYRYILDHQLERCDPVSRYLPDGLHGSSVVVDPNVFAWTDKNWRGLNFKHLLFYELHIGTFTPQGTFDAAIEKIAHLKELGITCIELMPVAQFPGRRNWGYDGASLYAVQNSYGGPEGLRRFVDACHAAEIAVCLDVVYNHFGPEGTYLRDFGPYFTDKYGTPWGAALNYDDTDSDPVRHFILQNALYWLSEYHIDALRLDAIHGIFDFSAKHILEELQEQVEQLSAANGRRMHLIAESDLNDTRLLRPRTQGGYQLAAQWSDDFHHSVHALLSGETAGYYRDFGKIEHLAKSLEKAFVYDGGYSAFRRRRHGNSTNGLRSDQFVVCTQNHDQVGNRAEGDRHAASLTLEDQKIAAALLLCSPYIPLLFMGQEYGAANPFPYFIDHSDPDLIEAVRAGRKREFAAFGWGEPKDPFAEEVFQQAVLDWQDLEGESNRFLLKLHQDLIQIRKTHIAPAKIGTQDIEIRFDETRGWLFAGFPSAESTKTLKLLCKFRPGSLKALPPVDAAQVLLDTDWDLYGGRSKPNPGSSIADQLQSGSARVIICL